MLYRSSDGVDWAPTGRATADLYLADLSTRGDRLYAVGTETASVVTTSGRPVADLAVGWSDDAAQTWRRTKLDVDLAAIAAKTTDVEVGSLSIAAGPGGVVAVAGVTAQLDLAKVLPAGVDVPNGWAMTDTGIDILGSGSACPDGTTAGPPGMVMPTIRPGTAPRPGQLRNHACYRADGSQVLVTPEQSHSVERSFTWVELGIGGDVLRAVQGTPTAFWSGDGEAFERVDVPFGHLNSLQVTAAGTGFAMVGQELVGGATKAGMVRSADGRHWAAADGPPGIALATSVGQVKGRLAVVGMGERGPVSAVLDGGTWTAGSLSDLLGTAGTGPRPGTLAGAAVGPSGLVAVVQAHVDPPRNPSGADYQVLFSRDGLTWSSQPLAALIDGPVARIGSVTVTDSKVIVTAIPPSPSTPADRATVVVGTV